MRDIRAFELLIACVPFVYVGAKLVPTIPPVEVPVVIASAGGTALLAFYYLWGRWFARILAPFGFLGLVLLFLVTAADTSILFGYGAQVTLGVLLAAPVAILVVFAEADRGPGSRLVGLQLALLESLTLLAAQQSLGPSYLSATSSNLVAQFLASIHAQLAGLETLIGGGSPGTLPLASVNDAGFVALAGLAILVVVITIVRPVTGREVELPVFPGVVPGSPDDAAEIPGLSPSFREALRTRSLVEGPPRGDFPGLSALVTGVGGAVVFLVLAYVLPSWSLLVTGIAVLGGVATIVATLFRPLGERSKRSYRKSARGPTSPRGEGTPND